MEAAVRHLLERAGITVRDAGPGNKKTICPKCSHKRKNKTDPCLSVKIEPDCVVWHCHNCAWSGAEHDRPEADRERREPSARRSDTGRSWRQRIRSSNR